MVIGDSVGSSSNPLFVSLFMEESCFGILFVEEGRYMN